GGGAAGGGDPGVRGRRGGGAPRSRSGAGVPSVPSHGGERLDCRAGGIAPGAGEPTLSSPLASRGGVLGDPDGERRGTPRYAGGGEGVADPDPAGGIRGRRRGGGDRGISAGPGPASPGP